MYMYAYNMYIQCTNLSLFPLPPSLGSGGGLKLTISKAVLKQAKSAAAPPSSSSPLSTTLFVGPAPAVEQVESSGRGGRRGSRGGSRRGT